MLQPKSQEALTTSRVLWGALSFSIFLYGFVLFFVGKISGVFLPTGDIPPLGLVALAANLVVVGTYGFHQTSILPMREMNQKLSRYIICWALNESVALAGFIAVFMLNDGNGFYYLANALVALVGNLLTFPRK